MSPPGWEAGLRPATRATGQVLAAIIQFVVLLSAMFFVACPALAEVPKDEYVVKANWLWNFGKYIQWPKEVLPSNQSPFVIGILGTNPFRPELVQWLKTKTVRGHKVEVEQCSRAEQAARCHLVFISSSEKEKLAEMLGVLKKASVLTVGETEAFLQLGGVITIRKGMGVKVEILRTPEISKSAAARAKLTLDPQLLDLVETLP